MARNFVPALAVMVVACGLLRPSGAMAQGQCTPPVPPPPLNGTEASAEQLRAAIADARNFIGQANLYENCLREELQAARARAAAGGASIDPAVARQAQTRIAANRRLKDKVSSEAATAMEAYKKAHAN